MNQEECIKKFTEFIKSRNKKCKILHDKDSDNGKHMFYNELIFKKIDSDLDKYEYSFSSYSIKSRTQEKTIYVESNGKNVEISEFSSLFCKRGIYPVNVVFTECEK